MSEKIKKDPLLGGDDQGENFETPTGKGKTETKAKVEAKVEAPKGDEAKLKAEAIAKFPNDTVAQTKYILDNSPHAEFIVPVIEGEIGIEEVMINGYKLTIQRGVLVSLPRQVIKNLADKYRVNLEAGKLNRTDRSKDISEALG